MCQKKKKKNKIVDASYKGAMIIDKSWKSELLLPFSRISSFEIIHYIGIRGTTATDKLSVLPLSKAIRTMRSATEDDEEGERPQLGRPVQKSQTSFGIKLSNMPSDATTKHLSLAVSALQPVNSGVDITPYLEPSI